VQLNPNLISNLVLEVENLGRVYADQDDGYWALRGISFKLFSSSTLAVVGPNGSGKSTLLRILGGVESPSEGRATGVGRLWFYKTTHIGFSAEDTIQEAVISYASFLGIQNHEVMQILPSVMEWCEIRFPTSHQLRRLSFGMIDRIAFAINAFLAPSILICDGLPAVGDRAFRERCLDMVESLIGRGMALLVATNNTAFLKRFCKDLLVLENGRQSPSQSWARRIGLEPARTNHLKLSENNQTQDDCELLTDQYKDEKSIAILSISDESECDAGEDNKNQENESLRGEITEKMPEFNGGILSVLPLTELGSPKLPFCAFTKPVIFKIVAETKKIIQSYILADFFFGRTHAFRLVSSVLNQKTGRYLIQLEVPQGLLQIGRWRSDFSLSCGTGKSEVCNFEITAQDSDFSLPGGWTGRMPGPILPMAKWETTSLKNTGPSESIASNGNGEINQITLVGVWGASSVPAGESCCIAIDFKIFISDLPVRCCLDFVHAGERAFRIIMQKPESLGQGSWRSCATLLPHLFAEGVYDINIILLFPDPDGPSPLAVYKAMRLNVCSDIKNGPRNGWDGAMPGVAMPKVMWTEISVGNNES